MNDKDREIYASLDQQHKALFTLLKKYLDSKFENVTSNQGSLEAFILTVTSSETFQKIISEELERAVEANKTEAEETKDDTAESDK